jgi:regulatory protein YycI of two-component signal transduction system YycFG
MTNVGQQLDLFAGILLTQEQQEMVDKHIDACNKNAVYFTNNNQRLENMLIDAGFIKGKDFVNDFKTKVATREVTLGNNYNNTRLQCDSRKHLQ